ncbi:MAG: hypothetical protein WAT27_17005, partial [Chitinophagales bacterium]
MDTIQINITDIPNEVTINVSNLQGPHGPSGATATLQEVVTNGNTITSIWLAQSPSGFTKFAISDTGGRMRFSDGNYITVVYSDQGNAELYSAHGAAFSRIFATADYGNTIFSTLKNAYQAPLHEFDNMITIGGLNVATENMVHATVQSNIKIIGDWDASSGSYPLADESNTTP